MTLVCDIYNFLNEFAPFNTALSFDNVGVLVGDYSKEISKVLLALDITKEVVSEAEKLGAKLIISHHPVIFSPLKSIDFNSVVHLLCKLEINAICAHTNLDVAPQGVNFHLAHRIGLSDLLPLTFEENQPMGFVGVLGNEMQCKDFAIFVKNRLCCTGVRYTQTNNIIKKVAVCSGSGGAFVKEAHLAGADAFVTGEIKHSQILQANELGLMVVDAGHFKSENVVIEPLQKALQKKFENVEFLTSKNFSDKIEYL